MSQLTTFLRSLGARGAVDNVRAVLDARRQEDWAVAVLSARLDDDFLTVTSGTVVAAMPASALAA